MAKARLIDFRGGINQKISPHMIGDSQGQKALDVDLSSVRLQGRPKIDTSEKAEGTFYYDTSSSESRWVSTDSADTEAYIEYSSDFAVWNRDLYVALGSPNDSGGYHSDGKIVRYLDGAFAPSSVSINAPASASVALSNATYTAVLINSISAGSSSGNVTGVVSTTGSNSSTSPERFIYTVYNRGYVSTGGTEPDAYGGRTIWTRDDATQYVVAASNGDGVASSLAGDLLTFSGGSITPTSSTVTVANADSFKTDSSGNYNNSRKFIATGSTRNDSSGNTYNEYSSSVLGLSGWALNNSGSLTNSSSSPVFSAYTGLVNSSNLSTIYPTFSAGTAYSDQGYSFTPYTNTNGTRYMPTSGSGLGLTLNQLYTRTQSGGNSDARSVAEATSNTYSWTWSRKFEFKSFNSSASGATYIEAIDFASGAKRVNVFLNGSQLFSELITSSTASTNLASSSSSADVWWVHIQNNGILGVYKNSNTPVSSSTSTSGNVYRYYDYFLYYTTSSDSYLNIRWNSSDLGPSSIVNNQYTQNTGNYYATSSISISGNTYTKGTLASTVYNGTSFGQSYWIRPSGTSHALDPTTFVYAITQTSNVVYSYSTYTHTQSDAYSFSGTVSAIQNIVSARNYLLHTLATPYISPSPGTPAFTYDVARTKIYEVSKEHSALATDNSFSANWLAANQEFDGSPSNGYFVQSVINSSNLPQISNLKTRAAPPSTSLLGINSSALNTPLRLDLSLTPDGSTSTVAYRLTKVDNSYSVDLGYVMPDSGISFSYSTSNHTITISGLANNTNYKLKFHAYQDSAVQIGTSSYAKTNVDGFEFTTTSTGTHPSITLATISNGDSRFLAADFWLKKQVLAGSGVSGDETYAVVRCFDVLHDTSNSAIVSPNPVQATCDYLDGFTTTVAGLGLGIGSGSNTATDAPAYLKFLKESNNFFFGVGTANTEPVKYGGTNKKGSYLFVSAYNDPTNWPLTGYVQFDREITGLATYPGELIVFTENAVYRVTGSRYDQMRKTKLATTEGLAENNHRTISLVNSYLCWLSSSGGICFYNGATVTNLSRDRFTTLTFNAADFHAGQFDGVYYLIDSSERGYAVDFKLEGFPISEVNLSEESITADISNYTSQTTPKPVLHYVGSLNKLYSRRGVIAKAATRNLFSFQSRDFDGGSVGSIKLIKNVTVNGTGSGRAQIYVDESPVYTSNSIDLTNLSSVPSWNHSNSSGLDYYYDNSVLTASINTIPGAYFQLHMFSFQGMYQSTWGNAYPANYSRPYDHAMLFVPDFGGTTYGWNSSTDVASIKMIEGESGTTASTGAIDNNFWLNLKALSPSVNFDFNPLNFTFSPNEMSGWTASNLSDTSEWFFDILKDKVFYAEITYNGAQHPFLFKINNVDLSGRTIYSSYPYGGPYVSYLGYGMYHMGYIPQFGIAANYGYILSFEIGYIPYYTLATLPADRAIYGSSISIDVANQGNPARIYLPASRDNIYGLPVADTWSVELLDWDGRIDWIDTEYEILSN